MLHYINLAKDQLKSLKGQIEYCQDCIKNNQLESWEIKEYQAVIEDAKSKIPELESRIEWMESEL